MIVRRKPGVTHEAVQFIYTTEGVAILVGFCGSVLGKITKDRHMTAKAEAEIVTLEDGHDRRVKHIATEGDWIVKGVQGEFYPVKPDIFNEIYEEVVVENSKEKEKNYGWTCPQCGAPNAPTNSTCIACFSPSILAIGKMLPEDDKSKIDGPIFLTEGQ